MIKEITLCDRCDSQINYSRLPTRKAEATLGMPGDPTGVSIEATFSNHQGPVDLCMACRVEALQHLLRITQNPVIDHP